MRVLDTLFGHFVEIDPKALVRNTDTLQREAITYAILSHTWDPQGEQTYQELREIQKRYPPPSGRHDYDRSDPTDPLLCLHVLFQLSPTSDERASSIWTDPKLSPKIAEACRVAYENGFRYLWIDSCCIDKASSSELSESINSMYQWYTLANVCHAFLPDVPAEEDHRRQGSHFRKSRWFTRGWTLQELIAPLDVRFLSMEWTLIASKESLADVVVEITKIHYNALLNIERLDEFSVAQRFSWAADRKTTREEDQAYSLLGIFNINMPTLYGEGAEGAFRRLQEEIMRRTPDQSLFAWRLAGPLPTLDDTSPLLNGPDGNDAHFILCGDGLPFLVPFINVYRHCTGINALSHDEVAHRLQLQPEDLPARRYDFTPYGICVQLPVIPFSHFFPQERIDNPTGIPLSKWYLIILGCGHKNFPGHLLARIGYIQSSGSNIEFLHSGRIHNVLTSHLVDFDLLPLSPATITHLHSSGGQISLKTFYIPQPKRDQGPLVLTYMLRHQTIKLVLSETTCEALSAQGYTVTLRSPDHAHARTHSVTLSHDTHTITIDYRHTLKNRGVASQELAIEADVNTSGPVLPGASAPDDLRVPLAGDGLGSTANTSSGVFRFRVDSIPWTTELHFDDIELTDIPGGPTALTMRLRLAFAKTNYYLLHIELKMAHPVLSHAPVTEIQDALDGRPDLDMSCSHCRAVENVDTGAVAARDRIAGASPMPGHGHGRWKRMVGAMRQGEGASEGGSLEIFPVILLTVMATFSLSYVAFVIASFYVTCLNDTCSVK